MAIKKKSARPISAQEASIARGNFPAQAREYWLLLSPVARERIASKLREPPSEPRDSFFVADAAPGGRDLLFPILTEIAKLARAGARSGYSESGMVKIASVSELRGRAAWAEWVKEHPYYLKESLPSENGGKPSYDDDFRAGFKAGAAVEAKAPNTADITRAQREFKKRGHKKHGSWWIDGFTVPIDIGRRAYATTPALIAARMGLFV